MSFHRCKMPEDAKVGDKYKCICGRDYVCSRRWPWRQWVALVVLAMVLPGCAALQTTAEIIDILVPDPVPVCDAESVGVEVGGDQCVKLSDGAYVWRAK